MAVPGKIFVALKGWDYEGEAILGVYNEPEFARTAIENAGYCDFVEIQVFYINGERVEDDPEEYFHSYT